MMDQPPERLEDPDQLRRLEVFRKPELEQLAGTGVASVSLAAAACGRIPRGAARFLHVARPGAFEDPAEPSGSDSGSAPRRLGEVKTDA
jgi:hypothetical protein